jgi:hypothetical protein
VPVLGDHLVAEPLVEQLVSGKLATNADTHLAVTLRVGIVMDPGHQRPADTRSLVRWVDGHPSDVQMARFAIEPQAADRSPVQQSQRPAGAFEVLTDGRFGFAEGAAWWIEPAVLAKCRLGQPVNLGRVGRLAETDLEPYQFDSRSIRPFRRAARSAQPKTRWATMSVAAVVRASRSSTSASDSTGNIRIAWAPSRLRRMISIQ